MTGLSFTQWLHLLYNSEEIAALARRSYTPPLVTFTREDIEVHGLRVVKAGHVSPRPPEFLTAVEVLDRDPRVVIKAASGMGKSLFLKMTALSLAGEEAGNSNFNLSFLTAPVERKETNSPAEPQAWSHGALQPVWLDAANWAAQAGEARILEFFLGDSAPSVDVESLLLVDNLDEVNLQAWEWMGPELAMFLRLRPKTHFVAAVQDYTYHRLRLHQLDVKEYSLRLLTQPLMHRLARTLQDCAGLQETYRQALDDSFVSAGWQSEVVRNPQYLSWLLRLLPAGMPRSWKDYYARVERIAGPDEPRGDLAIYARVLSGISGKDAHELREILSRQPAGHWPVIRMVKNLLCDEEPAALLEWVHLLTPAGEPRQESAECISALLAAELYASLRSGEEPNAGNQVVRQLRAWIYALVCKSWLTAFDRYIAGKHLAWLGDPRDFDELVAIQPGSFWMGSNQRSTEKPVHPIALSGYRISKYPVVNRQYRKFIQATGREWPTPDGWQVERSNAPAIHVSWHDARAYCAWLTQEWRKSGRIANHEIVRLPTEAEWERAALCPESADQKDGLYPWGWKWEEERCNSLETGLNDTCTVGMFPLGASAAGCLDMSGQVWEWVSTLFGANAKEPDYPYPYSPEDGREKLDTADNLRRVLRGGSFGSPFDRVTCTYRGSLEPIGYWRGDGFRVVVASVGGDAE